ncbi:MAG: hypothetical protein Q9201_007586 [Fulgogasparrea decipioides]
MANHPNDSPLRDPLSPDVENSFFRSWALRTHNSEFSNASDVSPGTRTPLTTPVSPKTVPRQRRQRPSYESRSTESYVQQVWNSPGRRDIAANSNALSQMAPGVAAHEHSSAKTRGSLDSSVSRTSSTSSIVRRALKLVRGVSINGPPSTSSDKLSDKPVKSELAWKRELSGHWLEIRIGKKEQSKNIAPGKESPEASYPTPVPASHLVSQMVGGTRRSKSQTSLSQPLNRSTDSSSTEGKPKKSIIHRTKKIFGIKPAITSPSLKQARKRSQNGTEETLDRASSALRELADKTCLTPPSTSTSTSNLSAASIAGRPKQHRRKFFRGGGRPRPTGHSSSSSVRRVLYGNPPVSTPNSESMYTGSDSQQYLRVELTDPDAPAFLPSEARRIGTPPLPVKGTKLRGFFFDYNAPKSASDLPEGPWPNVPVATAPLPHRQRDLPTPSRTPGLPRSPGARLQRGDSDIDWFRVKVAIDEEQEERDKFELNVPEHLPSSPLCPRHPKHKSGGKGVCVYHGRNKTAKGDGAEEACPWR